MKRKDILISVAIIAAAGLTLWFYLSREGQVRIDGGDAAAMLRLHNGWFHGTKIVAGLEPSLLSARVYRPQYLSISKGQNGYTWQIDSHGPWGNLSSIKVKNNQTTNLRLGPPFSIKPLIIQNGSVLSIDYAIVGRAGEIYQNSATKDGQRLTGADIRIFDEAGNVLESGKFSYG